MAKWSYLSDTAGDRSRTRKLSALQVRRIRGWIAEGWSNGEIARVFGVTKAAISAIRTGRRWTD